MPRPLCWPSNDVLIRVAVVPSSFLGLRGRFPSNDLLITVRILPWSSSSDDLLVAVGVVCRLSSPSTRRRTSLLLHFVPARAVSHHRRKADRCLASTFTVVDDSRSSIFSVLFFLFVQQSRRLSGALVPNLLAVDVIVNHAQALLL